MTDKKNAEMELLLQREVDKLKALDFLELTAMADKNEVLSPSHLGYQMEIQIFWEDRKQKWIRVVGFIEEQKPKKWWNNFFSKNSYSFIKDASGKYIDE